MTIEIAALAADSAARTSTAEAVVFWVARRRRVDRGDRGGGRAESGVLGHLFRLYNDLARHPLSSRRRALFPRRWLQIIIYTSTVDRAVSLFVMMLIGVDLS